MIIYLSSDTPTQTGETEYLYLRVNEYLLVQQPFLYRTLCEEAYEVSDVCSSIFSTWNLICSSWIHFFAIQVSGSSQRHLIGEGLWVALRLEVCTREVCAAAGTSTVDPEQGFHHRVCAVIHVAACEIELTRPIRLFLHHDTMYACLKMSRRILGTTRGCASSPVGQAR